jgi:lysophospholipase L1-like esterase
VKFSSASSGFIAAHIAARSPAPVAGFIFCALACVPGILSAQQQFYLKSGDTVVFYGDSITERHIYTNFIEAYVFTRFPKLNVRFVNSGWGGDMVTGGDGGALQVRLQRDVIAYQPNVVTVLLGMNDGRYRKLTDRSFSDFKTGYEKLVGMLKTALPNARLTLLEPSPYDDVTRTPGFSGGYNDVLMRFGEFVRALGEREQAMVVDLNSAVVRPLEVAQAKDPSAALEFIPDRVHPGPAASLLMAEAILKSWHAPAIVTEIEIDAEKGVPTRTVGATVIAVSRARNTLSWTQTDEALPFPVDLQDSPLSVAAYTSDFFPAIDDQPLKVRNLKPGDYTLKIDGQAIATYPADQFARGINLAQLMTPMLEQAGRVLRMTNEHVALHLSRWRMVQIPLAQYELSHYSAVIADLDTLEQELIVRMRSAAQPKPHLYQIVPSESAGRAN